MSDWRITALGAESAAAMAAVHRCCFADAWDADTFAAFLAAPHTFAHAAAHAARSGAQLTGFVLWRCAADEAEVLTLAVAPAHRRRGLASLLLDAVAAAAYDRGVARLFCEVAEDNGAARALYRRLGFADVGRRPGYYPRATQLAIDALIVCRPLP